MKKKNLWAAALLVLAIGLSLTLTRPAADGGLAGKPANQPLSPSPREAPPASQAAGPAGGRIYYSKRLYGLKGDWSVPSGKLRDVLGRLAPRASAGDAAAAYELFLKLRECRIFLARGFNEQEADAYKQAGAGKAFLDSTEQTVDDCADAGDLLRDNPPGPWLEKAADAGLLDAQLLYATDWRAIFSGPEDLLRDPGRVAQYREKAMRFLADAAADGNLDALMLIHGEYDAGVRTRKDPIQAYAYYYALRKAAPQYASDARYREYSSRLSPAQKAQADSLGEEIYNRCCR